MFGFAKINQRKNALKSRINQAYGSKQAYKRAIKRYNSGSSIDRQEDPRRYVNDGWGGRDGF